MLNDNRSQAVVVAVVYTAVMFMSVLDTTIVTVALPAVARDFRVSAATVGSVSIAYLVALTVFIPVSGWLGDRLGGKRVLLAAIGLFTVGSALCGCATSLPMLIAFSAVQGTGGAVMLPVGLAMLFRVYPPADRVRLSSTLALVTAIGPALGPILGGLFTTYVSWRLVFFVNVPIGVAAIMWGVMRLASHTQPHPGRLDGAGFVLAAVGLGSLMTGVSEGAALGWNSPLVLAAVAVGAVALAMMVVVELRTDRPLIQMRLFRNRLFSAATGLYGLGAVAYIGALYLISVFLQEALGASALTTGLTSVGAALGVTVGGQVLTRVLYSRIGPRRLTAGGLVLIAVSLAIMAGVGAGTTLWAVRGDLFVLGLGVAAVFIPAQAISMATISKADTAKASPVFNAGKQLGSAVGVALLSAVVGAFSERQSVHQAASGLLPYRLAFLVAAVVALGSIAVALSIRDEDAAATMARRPASRQAAQRAA